jgi:DNA adenine methylase
VTLQTLTGAAEPAPIVKWVGGKTRILSQLLPLLPPAVELMRHVEPFVGGGAMFFSRRPERALLCDTNAQLCATYAAVRDDVDGVIERLRVLSRGHDEDRYYVLRHRYNHAKKLSDNERAALFIYLNKTCFNGLWRVNRSGDFNVPIGRYTDPPICVPETLHAASALLRRADLRCGDYREVVADARRGDFLYFDPPYDPLTPTASFTSYTASVFGADQQRELAETARGLVARGCQVMLSNSDTPFIRSLYKDFHVDRVKCSRAINSNAAKRGDVDEVIITAGY